MDFMVSRMDKIEIPETPNRWEHNEQKQAKLEELLRNIEQEQEELRLEYQRRLQKLAVTRTNLIAERDQGVRLLQLEISQVRAAIKLVQQDQMACFEPQNFRLVSCSRVNQSAGNIWVLRSNSRKTDFVQRIARWWIKWQQVDDQGNHIKFWSGPAIKQFQQYPEFIRPNFAGYNLTAVTDRHFDVPPPWVKCTIQGGAELDLATDSYIPIKDPRVVH